MIKMDSNVVGIIMRVKTRDDADRDLDTEVVLIRVWILDNSTESLVEPCAPVFWIPELIDNIVAIPTDALPHNRIGWADHTDHVLRSTDLNLGRLLTVWERASSTNWLVPGIRGVPGDLSDIGC